MQPITHPTNNQSSECSGPPCAARPQGHGFMEASAEQCQARASSWGWSQGGMRCPQLLPVRQVSGEQQQQAWLQLSVCPLASCTVSCSVTHGLFA